MELQPQNNSNNGSQNNVIRPIYFVNTFSLNGQNLELAAAINTTAIMNTKAAINHMNNFGEETKNDQYFQIYFY